MEKTAEKAPEKMLRVRCMKEVVWGPTPKLQKLYQVGDELTIPESRFTDYHEVKMVKGMAFRGAFELADRPKAEAASGNEDMQALQSQNEELRRQIAILTGNPAASIAEPPKGGKGKKEAI